MKIKITEEQYLRVKKGVDCPNKVIFEYVTAVTLYRGRRTVCVNDEFFGLLKNYRYGDKQNEVLIKKIKDYFWETYSLTPDWVKISVIDGGESPRVAVKYFPQWEQTSMFEGEKDDTAKWIKCRNCKKKFTQTIHKGKEGTKVCPYCHTHN